MKLLVIIKLFAGLFARFFQLIQANTRVNSGVELFLVRMRHNLNLKSMLNCIHASLSSGTDIRDLRPRL